MASRALSQGAVRTTGIEGAPSTHGTRITARSRRTWLAGVVLLVAVVIGAFVGCAEPIQPTITITPDEPSLIFGESVTLTVLRSYPHGPLDDISGHVAYSVSDPAIADVDARGRVTAGQRAGTVVVRAVDPDSRITVAATVRVAAPSITSIDVTPATGAALSIGESRQLVATARYAGGAVRDVTAEVAWSTSDPSVVSVGTASPAQGMVTALGAGEAIVTASAGGAQGRAAILVTAGATQLTALIVGPNPGRGLVGTVTPMSATGIFSDGSTRDLTAEVTWTSTVEAVATVDAAGKVSALAAGTTTITATGREPATAVKGSAAFAVE